MGIAVRRLPPIIRWLLPAALAFAATAVPAQTLDPGTLQSLQSRLGAGTGIDRAIAGRTSGNVSAVPESRAETLTTGRIDTIEEQEVRRVRARQTLQQLYVPSPIERDYQLRLDEPDLRQFGYDFFQSAPPPTGSRTGAIGDNYVLGVGDELQVNFRGSTNQSQTVRVDRDGRVLVDGLAPVVAAGRTLAVVRREIEAETKRSLLATDVFVNMGEVRAVSVFVGGEVVRPGQFVLTSMSGVANAIGEAGGVRRSGSLRRVRVVRASGETSTVDLYGLLGIGRPPAIQLRDGDRVIVPVIGPTVAVTGAVPRPGIYELGGRATVAEVVAYAGGAIRSRGAGVVVSRIDADGSENFERAVVADAAVLAGDAIQIVGGSAGGAIGRVRLSGAVANPGSRSVLAAPTVADLVGPAAQLPSDTYQLAAVLARRDAATGARVYQLVNLAQELRGQGSTALQGEDQLFVLARRDIRFLNSAAVRRIILGQPNMWPECRALENLDALVKDTESRRFNAVTRGSFVVITDKGADLSSVGGALGQDSGEAADLAANGQLLGEDGMTGPDQTVRRPAADELQSPDAASRRNPLESRCNQLFEQETGLLPILLEHSISVGGAVRNPGAYPVAAGVTARDIALIAGGIVAGASDLSLDITRASDSVSERVDAAATADELSATRLNVGDDIRFNAQQPSFEASGVLLAGEVRRPGLYTIRRGETLAGLLERAGGLTGHAYPYGTVFTRHSVREAQQKGFERTARELNNSLLAVAARSNNGNTQGLVGAASLVKTISEAEASGRMVVESDPRVLALRPDLDTALEAGDSIYVPKRPNFVIALGDVNNPGALQFVAGKTAREYLRDAGGTLSTADSKRAFLVLPNGTAQPIRDARWAGSERMVPPPGSTLIVPKNIDPLYKLSVIRDVTTIFAQVASSVATVAVLATR